MNESKKVFEGAITLFYMDTDRGRQYLVVENAKTGNLTFVSGAKEDEDSSLKDVALRENREELGIGSTNYELIPTDVRHEFIFGEKKKERAGHRGSYHVFVADMTNADVTNIAHTDELKSVKWMTEKEVLDILTFPDLKEVFIETIKAIDSLHGR